MPIPVFLLSIIRLARIRLLDADEGPPQPPSDPGALWLTWPCKRLEADPHCTCRAGP